MLRKFLTTSSLSHAEVCRRLELDKGRFTRILNGQTYADTTVYDKIYKLLAEYGGKVPMNEETGVVAYPSGRDLGTWDIYLNGGFMTTLVFYDLEDVYNFVDGDERCKAIQSFMRVDTTFENMVKVPYKCV